METRLGYAAGRFGGMDTTWNSDWQVKKVSYAALLVNVGGAAAGKRAPA